MSSFLERRAAIKADSQTRIAAAQNSDRQARSRARTQVKKEHTGFDNLPEDQQAQILQDADDKCMQRRVEKGQDADTKRAKILDDEAAELGAIKKEEMKKHLELLGTDSKGKKRKRDSDDDKTPEIEERPLIQKAFEKNMVPVIKKWERNIIAGEGRAAAGISQEELEVFTKNASNPDDVKEYLEYLAKDKVVGEDGEAGLEDEEDEDDEDDEDDDDLEIVISEDEQEDDEDEDDEDMGGFIVEDDEEL